MVCEIMMERGEVPCVLDVEWVERELELHGGL